MTEPARKVRPTTLLALALIALLFAAGAIARFYTDVLWFDIWGRWVSSGGRSAGNG
jgi:uncharacterized membrane protein (UPF0182 family)